MIAVAGQEAEHPSAISYLCYHLRTLVHQDTANRRLGEVALGSLNQQPSAMGTEITQVVSLEKKRVSECTSKRRIQVYDSRVPCKTDNGTFLRQWPYINEYFPGPHHQYVSLEPSSFISRGYCYAQPVVVCLRLGSGRHFDLEFAPSKSHMPPRRYVPLPLPPPPLPQTLLLRPRLLELHRDLSLRATPRWPVARSHESWLVFCQSANPGPVRGICSVAQRNEKLGTTKDTSKVIGGCDV